MRIIKPEGKKRPPRDRPPSATSSPSRADPPSAPSDVKLLLVAFRSGEAVRQHPDLQSWLAEGWHIRSATPRIVESGDTKLLVVLERPIFMAEPTRPPIAH